MASITQKTCKVEGCGKRSYSRNYCKAHYAKFRRYGLSLTSPKYEHHGMVESSEYKSWADMKQRCTNKKDSYWRYYGGRGIRVCKALMKFSNFIELMGKKHDDKTTIDRKNVDGHYSCGKCEECIKNGWSMNLQWADYTQQADNKTNNHYITIKGVTKTLTQWNREMGFSRSVIPNRIKLGWSEDDLLLPVQSSYKKQQRVLVTINGITKTVTEWAKESGIVPATLWHRVKYGWPEKELLSKPNQNRKAVYRKK